jgi:hypothetical protein
VSSDRIPWIPRPVWPGFFLLRTKGHCDVKTERTHDPGYATRRAGRRNPTPVPSRCSPTRRLLVSPEELSERNVEEYILYVRDELEVAKGTFVPMLAGLKFFYLNTLGYDWPLFTKKKSASHAGSGCPTSAVTRTAAA